MQFIGVVAGGDATADRLSDRRQPSIGSEPDGLAGAGTNTAHSSVADPTR
jgi:hypothetical protein